MEIVIGLVVAVVVAAAVVVFGRNAVRATERRTARDELEGELRGVVEAVRSGRVPDQVPPDGATAGLVRALEEGWAPRDTERRAALSDAVGRVSRFLDRQVRAPLAGVSAEADEAELRERIERALGALEDVDFFLREAGGDTKGIDLVQLSQKVSREFAADHEATVRLQLGAPSLRATVEPDQLMDALYLILHNAARFGGGATIDMTVVAENARPTIRVRDRGQGFTEGAFKRAFDPFYSETEDGLGLGLPHARKSVEAMGGEIKLRNVPDGGAEVEVSLPA